MRWLILSLIVMVLFLTIYYEAGFTACLTVVTRNNVNSLIDVKERGIRPFFLEGHPITDHFIHGTLPIYRDIFQSAKEKYGQEEILHKVDMNIQKSLREHMNTSAFISYKLITSIICRHSCNKYKKQLAWIGKNTFAPSIYASLSSKKMASYKRKIWNKRFDCSYCL